MASREHWKMASLKKTTLIFIYRSHLTISGSKDLDSNNIMYSRAKNWLFLNLPALFICMLILSSCENSLNDIKKIASEEGNKPISVSTDVDIIYSESAKVKARLTTPKMIEYLDTARSPYCFNNFPPPPSLLPRNA